MLLPIASKFGPQEVNRFNQLCAKFQLPRSFELQETIFSNLVRMALPSGRILSRLLRRMKACIDEFRPNTGQGNYFGGFWKITSEINAKKEVRKKYESLLQIRRVGYSLVHILLKRSEIRPAEIFAFKALLILMTYISEFMFACF